MKNTNRTLGLACALAMIFCLGGCASISRSAGQPSSEAITSSSESDERSSSKSSSSSSESQSKSSSVPPSSATESEVNSSSAPVSSPAESQKSPSGASTEAEEEIVYIEPNRDLPNTPPETDNQKPPVPVIEPRSQQYESGKILLTCVKIDGTTYEVEVTDAATKKQVVEYVDGMKSSSYTVQNTPPGGGRVIDVEIHRNDAIELYAFSSQTQDGNALGRNFSGTNASSWTIADKGAFDYLARLLSME